MSKAKKEVIEEVLEETQKAKEAVEEVVEEKKEIKPQDYDNYGDYIKAKKEAEENAS